MPAKLLSKKQVVIRIGIIICLAEFLIMQLLASISYEAERSLEALIDAVLLAALSTPPIYVWVVKPFVNARDEALAQISHLAFTDPLTQLANRRLLTEHLEKLIAGSIRHGMYGALLLVDLDGFKHINDTHGHDAGDAVLIEIGKRLQTGVRAEDTIGRLGGDEFVVLTSNLDSNPQLARNKVARITESLIGLLSKPCVFRRETLHIGASIGVVPILDAETPLTDLMKAVDSACYVAKEKGRNRVHVSRPAEEDIARQHGQMQWMKRIQRAIEEDEFILYSQVISRSDPAASDDGHLELLLRMVENRGTESERIIPPSAFLPAAERYHLMPSIDRWVLDRAIHTLADPSGRLANISTCSINLSAQSITDPSMHKYITELVLESAVSPRQVCFEIAESAVVANITAVTGFMLTLRNHGFRFSLDDVGSGPSCFAYLRKLPVDYLKIDGTYTHNLQTDLVNQEMVNAMIKLARTMEFQIVAEQVEQQEDFDWLRDVGVDFVQGHFGGAVDKQIKSAHMRRSFRFALRSHAFFCQKLTA